MYARTQINTLAQTHIYERLIAFKKNSLVHVCMHTHKLSAYVYAYICVHVRIYVCMYVYVCVHVCMYACMHECIDEKNVFYVFYFVLKTCFPVFFFLCFFIL